MLGKVIIENGQKKIQALTADTGVGAPVGSYLYLEKKSNPQGYLYCDGSTFDETVYPALYQYLGTNVLPDWREFSAVGAEQNTTSAVIATHDVFTQGEEKDDQLQVSGRMISYEGSGLNLQNTSTPITYISASVTSDLNGVRGGVVTRGKSKAVFIYIKATSGLTENQQEDVLNTINENNSYSTEEHPTGAKWIDGKPIYRKVFPIGSALSCNANTWVDVTSYFSGLDTTCASIESLISFKYINTFPNDNSPKHQIIIGDALVDYPSDNKFSIYFYTGQLLKLGSAMVVEYTKTTD